MHLYCKAAGCNRKTVGDQDFCQNHTLIEQPTEQAVEKEPMPDTLLNRYPELYRFVGDMDQVDIFAIHHLFGLNDPSGCIHEASRTLLLLDSSGRQTYEQVTRARDVLNRWLELNGPNSSN